MPIRLSLYGWERSNSWLRFNVKLSTLAASLSVTTEVCLGVVFDSELTFSKHVKSVVHRCFYHLRQLHTVRKTLTNESVKTLVQALIASRLDYCNSVFYQISVTNLQALQSVLNSAARLVVWKRKYDSTWWSTLAVYQAANNVQVVYHRLQVCTWSSSIFSGRNVYSCRC